MEDVLDPPEDCFRIRMIITLVQTCGHYFDRGSSRRKLDKFLLYFQRYVLFKGPLPFDIEFDIQDMLAELRLNMMRYSSAEEVNAVLVELEENERIVAVEKISSEKHSDGESQKGPPRVDSSVCANGKSPPNGIEDNGRDHEDAVDSESYSDSGSIDLDGHEDEEDLLYEEKSDESESNDDEDDEDDEGEPVGSDEEDSVDVRHKLVEVDLKEEEDFDQELRTLMQESLESCKLELELRARPALNMMIPMNVFDGHKDPRAIEGESGEETVDEEGGGARGNNRVCVKVLVKKGNKQQMKQMYIPWDCSLVQSSKQMEAAELEEKQSIKRRILEYNEREEEESNVVSSQSGSWTQAGTSGNSGRLVGRGGWDGSSIGQQGLAIATIYPMGFIMDTAGEDEWIKANLTQQEKRSREGIEDEAAACWPNDSVSEK